MKQLFYIFAALLALVSCTKEIQEPIATGELLPEGTLVEATFSVTIPESEVLFTRALGEDPDLENLYVAIFGSTELQYWIPAQPTTPAGVGVANKKTYTVMLPVTNSPLQIHFIGNVPKRFTPANESGAAEIPTFSGSTEEKIMNMMISEDKKGGYWQKIKVDYIKATKGANNTIVMDYGSQGTLENVPLVRNFAKITYQANENAEFSLDAYTLINVPTRGYIAPWQSNGRYDNYYTNINAENFFSNLVGTGYPGYVPVNSIVTTKTTAAQPERTANALDPVYMYERPVPDATNQTAVIAKVTWKPLWNTSWGNPEAANPEVHNPADYILPDSENWNTGVAGKTYYYKIELTDSNDQYFPILRHIHYSITLNSLIGPGTLSTITNAYLKALQGPYFGNVSSSMEAANLNDITDNKTRLVVNSTDFHYLAKGTANITFQYYTTYNDNSSLVTTAYLEGETIPTTTGGVPVSHVYVEVLPVSSQGTTYEPAIDVKRDSDDEPILDDHGNTIDDITKGSGSLTVQTKSPSTEGKIYKSKIRLTGVTAGKRKLYREVTITVLPTMDLTEETSLVSSTDSETGKKIVTVTIGLPKDLPYSIFPLLFKIEAQNNNLATNDSKLPVQFGESAWYSPKNSFYFVRTIPYSEYCDVSSGDYAFKTAYECELFSTDGQDANVIVSNFTDNGEIFFNPVTLP